MPVENGKKTTGFPGIKILSKDSFRDAIIHFDQVNTAPTTATGEFYLFVNSSSQLVFNNGSSETVVGSAGSAGGSLDTSYDNGRTIDIVVV